MKKIKNKSLKSAHNPQEADRLARGVESVDKAIDGNYYPDNPVTRAEMAVFLVRAFSLP